VRQAVEGGWRVHAVIVSGHAPACCGGHGPCPGAAL